MTYTLTDIRDRIQAATGIRPFEAHELRALTETAATEEQRKIYATRSLLLLAVADAEEPHPLPNIPRWIHRS